MRPESVPFVFFLDSMDPGLSFDVYYSSGGPLVAEPEFFENRTIFAKIIEKPSF